MAHKTVLHAADELLTPALERALAAADLPESDVALVALTKVLAAAIDRMSNDERARMLGQTAPLYLKALVELDRRAARRGEPERPAQPNWLEAQREARARRDTRRMAGR